MINITQNSYEDLLQHSSFLRNGDSYEKKYGNLVIKRFSNCEKFWQYFIVPFTERISDYPNALTEDIRPRKGIDPQIEDIANTNYTTFLNLVYAHLHLQTNLPSSMEDFYMHLGSTCDLAETFLERCFFLLIKCRGERCETLQGLSREEFIQRASSWYDDNYLNSFQYYLSKGKYDSMKLPSGKNVIKELFEKYLKDDNLRKKYFKFSQSIRQFRNVIVHDVQVGRLQDSENNIYIPRPEVISQYRTWREVFAAANDVDIIKRDFSLKQQQMENDINELETILNELWNLIIQELLLEFYSEDRNILRNMYNLYLDKNNIHPSTTIITNNIIFNDKNISTVVSGTTGHIVDIPMVDHDSIKKGRGNSI